MTQNLAEMMAFHLTGRRPDDDAGRTEALSLRPALLAGYADLSGLRYDYPLVLLEEGGNADDGSYVHSLSGIVDALLVTMAPEGVEGERTRRQLLRLEGEIRGLTTGGGTGTLGELWQQAKEALLDRFQGEEAETLRDTLDRARTILTVDGRVVDCDAGMTAALLTAAWSRHEGEKRRQFRGRVDSLIRALDDILMADFAKSAAGMAPDKLRHAMGSAYQNVFDFEAMSRLLKQARTEPALPKSREERIRSARGQLVVQKFYSMPSADGAETAPHDFVFESTAAALAAFHERMPEAVGLLKAISIAELEVENRYDEARHDPYFDDFTEASLQAEDLGILPAYLILLRTGDTVERAQAMEALASGLPLKVLVQSDDILADSSLETGQFAFGAKSLQLATQAIGLNNAFVLQSAGSNLYQLRDRIMDAMRYSGPSLFSVFSGAGGESDGLPPYLVAAAAMESRAFPAFTYDPGAGSEWAERFQIADNPKPEADWPERTLAFEDQDLQTVSRTQRFSFVDFVATDRRHRAHFAVLTEAEAPEGAVPAGDYLALEPGAGGGAVPYVMAVDEENRLHKLIANECIIRAAKRCREMWHSLQELGGIHNSHARRLLAQEREIWEAEKERELAALKAQPAETPVSTAPPAVVAAPAEDTAIEAAEIEEMPEPPSDELWIETARCTTCNECTEINGAIFAYDENRQAYIADPDGGTFAEIVEATENCQVSIIHPGKPRNSNEPNLDELVKRAEPFI